MKTAPTKIIASGIPFVPQLRATHCTFGTEQQTADGQTAIAWWLVPIGDGNGEPVAGGYCATVEDARTDARAWLARHGEFSSNF